MATRAKHYNYPGDRNGGVVDGHEGGNCDDDYDTETDSQFPPSSDDDADDSDGDDEAGVRNGPPASSPNCDCHILGMPNRTCGSTAREASCTLCKIRSAGTRWGGSSMWQHSRTLSSNSPQSPERSDEPGQHVGLHRWNGQGIADSCKHPCS